MANETKSLTILTDAAKMLAEAKTFRDVKKIMDLSEAARIYAKAAHHFPPKEEINGNLRGHTQGN